MEQVERFELTYKEVIEALIKQLGLHEGVWALTAQLGFNAISYGPTPSEAKIAAHVHIANFGIHRVGKETSLSVDAAKVNPPSPKSMKPKGKR